MSETNPEGTLEDLLAEAIGIEDEPDEPDTPDEPTTPQGEEVVAEADEEVVEADADIDGEDTQDDGDETAESDEDEKSGDDDSDVETPPADNPAVLALLERYNGDKDAALLGYVESQKVISRQGQDNRRLTEQLMAAQAELEQSRMFAGDGPRFLTDEQSTWIEEAVGSGQTLAYVQQAIQVQEYDLARALVDAWGQENPFAAMRAGTIVERAEENAQRLQTQAQPLDHSRLLETIAGAYPDLPTYEGKMVDVIATLGENHPLVAAARSSTPEEAVQGIVGIYEIARAQEASVRTTKDGVKKRQREAGDKARQAAVVSSAGAAPAATQAPRQKEIMPGLTMEALVTEMGQ